MALFRRKSAPRLPIEAETDEAVMLLAAKGSEDAFAELIRRYQAVLLNLFGRLGAQGDEAEDAVQETFLRVHAYRFRYRPTAKFKTFLFTLARRAWLDLCRRSSRHERAREHVPEMDGLACSKEIDLGDRLDLEEGLASLPEGQRMVLILSIHGGLKYEEVAEVLGIPEGTVKSRVFHALRKLREREPRDVVP